MTFAQAALHLLDFFLPALALACLMPMAGRRVMGPGGVAWPARVGWHLLAGALVLLVGLVLQGQDGKMSTYAVLVAEAGSLEWLLHRRGRRA